MIPVTVHFLPFDVGLSQVTYFGQWDKSKLYAHGSLKSASAFLLPLMDPCFHTENKLACGRMSGQVEQSGVTPAKAALCHLATSD